MGAEAATAFGGGASGAVPGLMSGPSVDQLLNSINGQPVTQPKPEPEKPVSAGVSSQALKPPPTLGQPAPKEAGTTAVEPKPAAKPAAKIATTVVVTVGGTDAGKLLQGTVGIRVPLSEKDTFFADGRVRSRLPDARGKSDAIDYQVGVGYERLLAKSSDFKLTGAVSVFGRVDQPLDGGDLTGRLGVQGEVVASFKPAPPFELRSSVYVKHEHFFPKGNGLTTIGGDLRFTATEHKSNMSLGLGVRGEVELTDGGATPMSVYLRGSIPVNKQISVFGEGFVGIHGDDSKGSALWTQNDGGVGVFFGVRGTF